MQKALLERFIGKYNLGGAVESVILESEKGSVKTKFITTDKNAAGFISTDSFAFEAGSYGVYDTAQLRSILSVLEPEVDVSVSKNGDGAPTTIMFSDDQTKASFALADKSNIPVAPDMKKIPPFEVTISLDAKFVGTFVKAKSALSESERFTVLTAKDKTVSVVLGHSDMNTNRISIKADATVTTVIPEISFSSVYFRDMLLANKEMKSGKLHISSAGLAFIEFELEEFSVKYFLVKVA